MGHITPARTVFALPRPDISSMRTVTLYLRALSGRPYCTPRQHESAQSRATGDARMRAAEQARALRARAVTPAEQQEIAAIFARD